MKSLTTCETMKLSLYFIQIIFSAALLTGCGKPPSGGGGPPEGDFPSDVVGAPVTVEPLRESVQLVGSFGSPEDVTVVSRVDGEIMSLPVKEGSRVKKGEVLAELDVRKIKARLADARARMKLSDATLRRAEELRKTNSISAQEYDEALASVDQARATVELLEAELDDATVEANMDGMLTEHMVSVGQVVSVGRELMSVVQLNPLEIAFEVPERYLSALTPGLQVNIRTDVFPDQLFEGKLTYLAPRLRATTRTLPVKAEVPNPDGLLRPGMFGKIELVLSENEDAMFVPESAVLQKGTQNQVIVRNEAFRAEFRDVEVGVRQGGRMQIRSGLEPDDLVVAEGTIKVFFPGMLLNFTEDSNRYGLEASMAPMPESEGQSGDEETANERE